MTTQPEALFCAEMLEVARDNPTWVDYSEIPKEACRRSAAELRRLSAENDLLGSAADKLRLAWRDEVHSLIKDKDQLQAQRDALLEGYRKMKNVAKNVAASYSNFCDDNGTRRRLEREFDAADAIVRAAIKAVEEGK